MKYKNLLLGTALFVSASVANAVSVFVPTDGDINFALETGDLNNMGYTLSIFDDAGDIGVNPGLAVSVPELIYWDANITQLHDATLTDTLTIADGDFVLAIYDGSSWTGGDINYASIFTVPEANTYAITFGGMSGFELVIDLTPIPVPAAVWLLGTGLIGFAGVARRRG